MINNNIIKKISRAFLIKKKWPMSDKYLNFLCRKTFFLLQEHISKLTKLGDLNSAKNLIEKFSFNLITRLWCIHLFTSCILNKVFFSLNRALIWSPENCLWLLNTTNYLRICKKYKQKALIKKNKFKRFKEGIIDIILQQCLIFLIEPYYEVFFSQEIFKFRLGRTIHNALAKIWKSISTKKENKAMIHVDIKKDVNTICDIFYNIWVPLKFRKLTDSWISYNIQNNKNAIRLFQEYKKTKNSLITLLFINIAFKDLRNYIFKNTFTLFPKSYIVNSCIILEDTILIISNFIRINTLLLKIKSYFFMKGFDLTQDKFWFLNFLEQKKNFKFLYYGFKCYLIFSSKLQPLNLRVNTYSKCKLKFLLFINNINFKNQKIIIKSIIKNSKNSSIFILINKLNFIIYEFSIYFNLIQNRRYFLWLDYFIYKKLLFWIKKKYKRSTIKWIIKFFILNKNYRAQKKHISNIKQLKRHAALKAFSISKLLLPVKLCKKNLR